MCFRIFVVVQAGRRPLRPLDFSSAKLQNQSYMKVKHIVQFQLKEELTEEQRLPIMQAFKAGIEALPATIPTILEIRVGFNINPAEAWHICLESTFDTLEDVIAYGAHPAHQAVAGALKPHVRQRSCVDFCVE